jgi:hypothetical protein
VKKLILMLLGITLLTSCYGPTRYIQIHKSENFAEEKKSIKKVVCISPNITIYTNYDLDDTDFERTLAIKNFFFKNLMKYNKASKFEYVIYNPSDQENTDASFYNDLLPLKSDLLQASLIRENPLNAKNSGRNNRVTKTVFAAPSRIAPEFSSLSKQYGTPYFSWYGIFSAQGKTVSIYLLVNVETSEMVYHEMKRISKRANRRNLPPLIYDSFKMMR